MYILAFETSCDDTSVAIMRDDMCIALATRTQLEHEVTGGVVPEVAARSHANAIFPCLDDVFAEAGIGMTEIDVIACTRGPGLAPSLLTGHIVAETLSKKYDIPLVWVDHIEAHIFANLLERVESDILFPSVVLTVSGGHTELYLWKSLYDLELIGQTLDDAAGESFDKVSKMLGMGFPGGARISHLATEYADATGKNTREGIFPVVLLESRSLDFSFSGLKSAVKRYIDSQGSITYELRGQVAFEFEQTVLDILVTKLFRAQERYDAKSICLAGGVSANTKLRDRIQKKASEMEIPFFAPTRTIYSMDNAAMIGIRAYYELRR